MTVDGSDFEIEHSKQFSKIWYGYKHNCLGVRYKIAGSMIGGGICWINGLYKSGAFSVNSKVY